MQINNILEFPPVSRPSKRKARIIRDIKGDLEQKDAYLKYERLRRLAIEIEADVGSMNAIRMLNEVTDELWLGMEK